MSRVRLRSFGLSIALLGLAVASAFGAMSQDSPVLAGGAGSGVVSFGPAQQPGQHVDSATQTPSAIGRPVSDQAVRQMVLARADGARVASRMLHRVTTPLSTSSTVRYVIKTSSENWGGYIDVPGNGPAQGAFAEFNDPLAGNGGEMASWAGVGGFTGNTVVQAGVDHTLQEAWTEAFPNLPVFWFRTHDGDKMAAEVFFDTSTGKWGQFIEDLNLGLWGFTETSLPGADRGSAEWITEVVTFSGPVPQTPAILFSSAEWLDSGFNWRLLTDPNATTYQMTLISPQFGEVIPGAIDGTGAGFETVPF